MNVWEDCGLSPYTWGTVKKIQTPGGIVTVYPHTHGEQTNSIIMFLKNFFNRKNSTTFFT